MTWRGSSTKKVFEEIWKAGEDGGIKTEGGRGVGLKLISWKSLFSLLLMLVLLMVSLSLLSFMLMGGEKGIRDGVGSEEMTGEAKGRDGTGEGERGEGGGGVWGRLGTSSLNRNICGFDFL